MLPPWVATPLARWFGGIILFLFALASVHQIALAQTASDSLSLPSISKPIDVARETSDSIPSGFTPSKSPALAMGLSALVPGAGQLYNESYWKTPIVVGLGGYFAYEWIHNDNLAQDYRDQYESSKTEDNPLGDTGLLAIRDFYKDQRDTFLWYFVILYVANVVDAYVDANLYDFDVGDDLSLQVIPGVTVSERSTAGVGVRVVF